MPVITLHTIINAPIERCFLLSLSVDLHKASVYQTKEKAIAGITSGIMQPGDTVTWEANHFGMKLQMTSKVSAYNKPTYFISEMIKGPFKKLHHQHLFREENGKTVMTDIFELKAPFGILGRIAETLFLTHYMQRFLMLRNEYIRNVAESHDWKLFID